MSMIFFCRVPQHITQSNTVWVVHCHCAIHPPSDQAVVIWQLQTVHEGSTVKVNTARHCGSLAVTELPRHQLAGLRAGEERRLPTGKKRVCKNEKDDPGCTRACFLCALCPSNMRSLNQIMQHKVLQVHQSTSGISGSRSNCDSSRLAHYPAYSSGFPLLFWPISVCMAASMGSDRTHIIALCYPQLYLDTA